MSKAMKRDYSTRCWLCNSTELEPDDKGIKCLACGATYNVIPAPGKEIFKGHGYIVSKLGYEPG